MDKLFLANGAGPWLYLAPSSEPELLLKADTTSARALYLNVKPDKDKGKGNPHRDPSVGQYIAGGGGAAKGKGQTKLHDQVELMLTEGAKK